MSLIYETERSIIKWNKYLGYDTSPVRKGGKLGHDQLGTYIQQRGDIMELQNS